MSEQQFDWGALGEAWWRENGAACRATEQQIRFACARHQGANKSRAATLAGYSGGAEALRSAGVRAEGTKAVEDLLTLAAVSEGGGDADGPATDAEIDRKLTKLIRSPDGAISLKAIEARDRRVGAAAQARAGAVKEPDDPKEEARVYMSACRRAAAPIIWGEFILRAHYWYSPFLHELAPYLRAHHPAHWQDYRRYLAGEYNQAAAQVDKLEKGPLLSLDEILAKVGVDAPTPEFKSAEANLAEEEPNADAAA
jgi:hypothetical protein